MIDWEPDPPDLPAQEGQPSDSESTCHNKQVEYPKQVVEPINEYVSRAQYDELNAENERLRLMLRLLLGESTVDVSQSNLIHRKPDSSIQQRATLTVQAPSSQRVVNMDVRGGSITDIGRDVHNHVHNHWIAINLSDGNIIAILVVFLG